MAIAAAFGIPKPLMPLGVEHNISDTASFSAEIPKPLMPLGVEHVRIRKIYQQ